MSWPRSKQQPGLRKGLDKLVACMIVEMNERIKGRFRSSLEVSFVPFVDFKGWIFHTDMELMILRKRVFLADQEHRDCTTSAGCLNINRCKSVVSFRLSKSSYNLVTGDIFSSYCGINRRNMYCVRYRPMRRHTNLSSQCTIPRPHFGRQPKSHIKITSLNNTQTTHHAQPLHTTPPDLTYLI